MTFSVFRKGASPIKPEENMEEGNHLKQNQLPFNVPNLPIFDTTLTNSSSFNSGEVDIQKQLNAEGIQMQKTSMQPTQEPKDKVEPVTQPTPDVAKYIPLTVEAQPAASNLIPASPVSPAVPKTTIQEILKIPNFEQKRIKLEAMVISTTNELKQNQENMHLVIESNPNFLDHELYQVLVKQKESLMRNLQIYEGYRKMFEEEERVRRLLQESEEDAHFRKSIRAPPENRFSPSVPTQIQAPSVPAQIQAMPNRDMQNISVQDYPVPIAQQQQKFDVSSNWNIASAVQAVEYKGACPNCLKITNYYNDVCHNCKAKIPMYIKEAIPLSPQTPGDVQPVLDSFAQTPERAFEEQHMDIARAKAKVPDDNAFNDAGFKAEKDLILTEKPVK